ncbi:hypothetical protein BKA56DRAFT_309966 [Ilyonectria sp. MPI-CAGE-AT-0026]|nr:hypothetical protein BKA56DRAFT_309966 [Ilyonectria sp. MPI-CAGE-AT-0026]
MQDQFSSRVGKKSASDCSSPFAKQRTHSESSLSRSTPGAVIMVPPKHREDGARGPALPAVRSNSYRRACDPRRPNRLEVVPRLISSCFGEVCGRIQHERRDPTTAITMPRLTAEHDARPVYQNVPCPSRTASLPPFDILKPPLIDDRSPHTSLPLPLLPGVAHDPRVDHGEVSQKQEWGPPYSPVSPQASPVRKGQLSVAMP